MNLQLVAGARARVAEGALQVRREGPSAQVRGLLALLALLPTAYSAEALQGDAARCRTDYRISATLDGETKALSGELEVDWTNGSGEAVQDLWFHTYLNAFSNNRSTHLFESKGTYRGTDKAKDGWGWQWITSIQLLGEGAKEDLFGTMRYRRPDDGREEDRTVFSVELPRPVPPGATITVRVTWESQLPRVRRRTGYKDDFLLVAQWFPKLGVYEAGRGWNCHQFHANSEFYADYGTYDVRLKLPPEYDGKVFGSGVRVENQRTGEWLMAHFRAPSVPDRDRVDAFGKRPLVHDFTWTGDPRFVVVDRIFQFNVWAERFPGEVKKASAIFGPDVDVSLRNVDVTVVVQPEHASQVDRHFEATFAALFFYGLWFGEYPYEHVTVVDPAWGAGGAGGMEYPTLFTCGSRLFTTPDMYVPESVTVHECGHQFWYGLVGNNEFEAAWLDEGFNSYTDSEVLWRVYGPRRGTTDYASIPVDGRRVSGLPGGNRLGELFSGGDLAIPIPFLTKLELTPLPASGFLELWRDQPALTFVPELTDPRWDDRSGYLADPGTDPIETFAWEYADRLSYRTNSYPRPAVALRTLPAVVGYDTFLRGMRHYAKEWRYRHPAPADFYASFQEGAEVDVDWYFREVFQGTDTVDWQVHVTQERRSATIGFLQSEGGAFLEQPAAEGSKEDAPWVLDVELRRTGDLRIPVPVRLTFEDGSSEEILWTREEQESSTWKRITREEAKKLVSAVIDPDRSCYLDADMSNNAWYDATDTLTPWRWAERVLAQHQRFFHWVAGLGG